MVDFNQLKDRALESTKENYEFIDSFFRTKYSELKPHLEIFTGHRQTIIGDFKELKVTPVTTSITIVALVTLLLVGKAVLGSSSSSKSNKGKKKSKSPKLKKSNKEIKEVLNGVEDNYVPQIQDYFQNFEKLTPSDREYKFNYFQEVLIKELLKLDGIEVYNNEVLRENRRKVIKFIQDYQKALDKFKSETGF